MAFAAWLTFLLNASDTQSFAIQEFITSKFQFFLQSWQLSSLSYDRQISYTTLKKLQTLISDSILAISLLKNNTMLFRLANTICQLHLLLFLMENNFWLLWIDIKTTNHVQVTGNKTCQNTIFKDYFKNNKPNYSAT